VGSYLQTYGAGEEQRNRLIKWIIIGCIAAVIIAVAAYIFFHDYPEQRIANNFLADVNNRNYQAAYRDWGCTADHPCPNYDYTRFMQDWGPNKSVAPPWRVQSVDSCKSFVTVNVQAQGSELQSLAVERDNHALSFAPAPECQEKQWRWKQFFERILHPRSGASS
jgi:hypothetical protein